MRLLRRIPVAVIAAATVAVMVAGCGSLNISGMQRQPEKYEGQQVELVLKVLDTQDVPLTQQDYYKVTDNTGQMWVQTRRGVPLKGAIYRVKGIFKRPRGIVVGFLLGDFIIEEHSRNEVEPPRRPR